MVIIVKIVTNIRNNRRSDEFQNKYEINNGNEPLIKSFQTNKTFILYSPRAFPTALAEHNVSRLQTEISINNEL